MKIHLASILLPLAAAGALAPTSAAQCPVDYVQASDHDVHSEFGCSLAVSGDWAIVGAQYDDGRAQDAGAAYFLELVDGRFVEVQKVLPPTSDTGQHFGRAVAIDGGRALVGAADNQMAFAAGAGFVYARTANGWVLEDTLFGDTPALARQVGTSVALEGELAVLGAPGNSVQQGWVLVFRRTPAGWVQVDELHPTSPDVVRGFGQKVALSNGRILVGAQYHAGAGGAFVFEPGPSGWTQTAHLVGHDVPANNVRCDALALDGDRAIYSTPYDGIEAAYLFELVGGQWSETKKFSGSGDALVDFGVSVAIRGDRVAVACLDDSAFGIGQEYVEVFRGAGSDWISETRITRAVGVGLRRFGEALALRGDSILLGCPYDGFQLFEGALATFNLATHAERLCHSTSNSTGSEAILELGCVASVDRISLTASPVPDSEGVFFFGTGAGQLLQWDGVRCVSGTLFRLPISSAAGHSLSTVLDLRDPFVGGARSPLQAGTTWNFQAWFRDPAAGGTGANFSSALALTLAP